MNRIANSHSSDESDSDFCPEKETGSNASDEVSSVVSSFSETECSSTNKVQKKQKAKLKSRKRARACGVVSASDADEHLAVFSECRRSTRNTAAAKVKRLCGGKEESLLEKDDKKRSDALYADFLNDVKAGEPSLKTSAEINRDSCTSNDDKVSATTTDAKKDENVTVTDVVIFSGNEVRLEKVVITDSVKDNTSKVERTTLLSSKVPCVRRWPAALPLSMAGGSRGRGSILQQLGKQKKLSVLEKSQLDWNNYKKDEGIGEELKSFNKGKDGYLERQDFLERTDLRQFEIEKNLRQSRRTK